MVRADSRTPAQWTPARRPLCCHPYIATDATTTGSNKRHTYLVMLLAARAVAAASNSAKRAAVLVPAALMPSHIASANSMRAMAS